MLHLVLWKWRPDNWRRSPRKCPPRSPRLVAWFGFASAGREEPRQGSLPQSRRTCDASMSLPLALLCSGDEIFRDRRGLGVTELQGYRVHDRARARARLESCHRLGKFLLVHSDDRWNALIPAVEAMAGRAHGGELGALLIVCRPPANRPEYDETKDDGEHNVL